VTISPRLHHIVAAQPYPLLFATISGAHLYGFPSPDSDYDLRGAHVLPLDTVVGLDVRDETVEVSRVIDGLEMDIVSHDVRKFFRLLLKKNGYVLEQLFSPLIVHTTPEHAELKEICRTRLNPRSSGRESAHSESSGSQSRFTSAATGVITKLHSHHYFGFAETQWKLFDKERPRRVKPLLYVYRVLLTGIYLMRTGMVNANLVELNVDFVAAAGRVVPEASGGIPLGARRSQARSRRAATISDGRWKHAWNCCGSCSAAGILTSLRPTSKPSASGYSMPRPEYITRLHGAYYDFRTLSRLTVSAGERTCGRRAEIQ
jgi:uncharacterized protein